MPTIRPFQFTGLRHFSKEQVALQASLARYLSYKPFRRRFAKALAQDLETVLKVPCRLSRPEISVLPSEAIPKLVPEVTCLVVIGAAPSEQKILVELDAGIASFSIDRLLGGSGEVGRIQRPLTEIEQGVLSFVLLKVLQQVHTGWETGQELTLTLDRFASSPEELREYLTNEAYFHVLGFKVGAGKRIGYARVMLPASMVTQTFSTPVTQGPSTEQELEYMRGVLRGLGSRQILARVEIATLDLTSEDIANIEVGDIIILENHQVALTPEGIAGKAFVKIGKGLNGGLQGNLINEGELSKLQIAQIVIQEQPSEEDPAMADGEPSVEELAQQLEDGPAPGPDSDNFAETEGLLRDINAPVVVELGRIKLNTHQVVKLRPGQILRLPRGPHDPVNLVVNGKLFARGELIEVDGELGVRLVQVVGA